MGRIPVSTLMLHRLCNLSVSSHATPIEFTHIDYYLGEDPSQRFSVGLGSRIPSLALGTTLSPESPRSKEDYGFSSHKFPVIRRKACFPGLNRP